MKIPYNQVHIREGILFAARGGKLHTFSLPGGSHRSTWKHPDVDKVADAVKSIAEANADSKLPAEVEASPGPKGDEPPAKRQRLASDGSEDTSAKAESEAATTSVTQEEQSRPNHVDGRGKKVKTNKGAKDNSNDNGHGPRYARVPDRPVITHLASTSDGSYLLVITGHDKVIWVFEHDGNGHLKQLSQRTMPKRPSSVAIAEDSQIICADKFGDVYALPLLVTDAGSKSSTPLSSLPLPTKKAFKPSANTLTVHSKGNRLALLNQIKQAELDSQSKDKQVSKPDGPDFELSLLLGHVSMLTSLVLGGSHGRKYILTSDRDEHIRVSRYIPHAHIIETFCLGHKEFINDMTIPLTKGHILVSGGGDDHLFIWDWVAGKLLSKANVLSLAQEIAPETTKVAVSSLHTLLFSSETGPLTYLLAICEDINAIFSWHLTDDGELHHPGVIRLPGKPLQLAICSTENKPPALVVAIDPEEGTGARSLRALSFTTNDGKLVVGSESCFQDDDLEAEETEISKEEVRTLLYTVESLRKLSGPGQEAGSENQVDAEGDLAADTGDVEE